MAKARYGLLVFLLFSALAYRVFGSWGPMVVLLGPPVLLVGGVIALLV